MTLPILYSLRNCPYAMRARLAIYKSKLTIELRDVVLTNKPAQMIAVSPKATVPILVLPSSHVIDESLDIMLWTLFENDPENLLHLDPDDKNSLVEQVVKANCSLSEYIFGAVGGRENDCSHRHSSSKLSRMLVLIKRFDDEFKTALEQYKCAKRYHESNLIECRQACEEHIQLLEQNLSEHAYIIDEKESLADIALLPFIRQFARVERQWYQQSPYVNVRRWLNQYLQSAMFTKVMAKYSLWSEKSAGEVIKFSANTK